MPASNKPCWASFCQIVLSCLACGSLLRCWSGWWNYIWTQTLNCWGVNSFWAKRQNSFAKATNNVFEGIRFGMWCANAWIIALSCMCTLTPCMCIAHYMLYTAATFAPPGCKANGQAAMIMTALRVPSSKFSPRPKHSNHSTSESLFVHALSTTFIVLCFQPVCGKKVGVVEKRMSLWADYQIRGKAWHDRSGRVSQTEKEEEDTVISSRTGQ